MCRAGLEAWVAAGGGARWSFEKVKRMDSGEQGLSGASERRVARYRYCCWFGCSVSMSVSMADVGVVVDSRVCW
jgi:hypothetical protein